MNTTFNDSKPRKSWLYKFTISICLTLFFSSCGLFESDVNETAHISQIVVSLDGENASKEMATVSINGTTVGTATAGNDFTKEVAPGNYDITARDRSGFIAWSPVTNIKIDTGKTFRYLLHCNKAKLTISIAVECLDPGKVAFPLSVYNNGALIATINTQDAFKDILVAPGLSDFKLKNKDGLTLWSDKPYLKYEEHFNFYLKC